ncbi:DUF3039 domain-containing protein [Leifsonia sp. Leaf264]|uniref:DUF3039 domain-containing protein n=1 Tax=Leifsonia sp. Leaf264 TaxID=1736314 RepID=UPI0006F71B9E|nr:DUF3039 domain-containing protein [Leifsonia sp. Leaf264]KQO98165.1 hypothetical protein ASF30_08885 [Leifsonia sp. Leaf264]
MPSIDGSVLEKEDLRVTDDGDHDTFAHYCSKTDISNSMLTGIEIKALCGKMWRPSKDFAKYPVCGTCKDIFETMRDE